MEKGFTVGLDFTELVPGVSKEEARGTGRVSLVVEVTSTRRLDLKALLRELSKPRQGIRSVVISFGGNVKLMSIQVLRNLVAGMHDTKQMLRLESTLRGARV
ncbi:hypothetical protein [Streptomyces sp. CBMA29]|uniref:hypothetical protein n=1 Tax=Streptomyces sp. CBMA29 TaxID=1896314 RepID=UPI001661B27B|nr:hypothetical protein [Streptomyces sp. CBMA29]MBD0739853.1 hypothetical protein [Streptomyces sp. CBMA29]